MLSRISDIVTIDCANIDVKRKQTYFITDT